MPYLRLLGPIRITHQGNEQGEPSASSSLRFRSRRTAALLGYLAAERRPVARDHLAALFWPDEEPARGRSNLRRELYNLAKILPDCWQTDSQTTAFVPSEPTRVDILVLDELQQQGCWQEAAELLTGEFLEGLYLSDNLAYETWLLAERERWRERSRAILDSACEEMVRHGHYADALPTARRLLRLVPWDEAAHRLLMQLLAWSDQREAALRQFEQCRELVAAELGVGLSAETLALREQIASSAPQHPPQLPAFVGVAKTDQRETPALFVMRERELAWLDDRLQEALAGHCSVVFVTGSPGRGKTALLDAFTDKALAAYPDLLVARGNCIAYGGVGDPYLPFRDILAMLSGDLEARWKAGAISTEHAQRLWHAVPAVVRTLIAHGPGLLDSFVSGSALLQRAMAAQALNSDRLQSLSDQIQLRAGEMAVAEQTILFEQFSNVLRAVATQRPLLLLLDDLQWVDVASVNLLFHLVRRITEGRSQILIVCAYRPEEIVRDRTGVRQTLATVLSEFRRMFGDVWLSLSWANDLDGRRFIDSILDSEPNYLGGSFRTTLHQRTGGHPLFTVELLHAMRERGDLIQDENGTWQESKDLDWQLMPARVEAVIEARIEQLEPAHQELLSVACVEGEHFTIPVLARIQNLEEGRLLRLFAQELGARQRLVREQEAQQVGNGRVTRYGFRHTLFQEYLYRRLSQGERLLLHSAVAAAMENVYAEDLEGMSAQLARHYDQAGDHGRALHYLNLAADRATRIYAHDEAIAHTSRAIDLARQNASIQADLSDLYCRRGLAQATKGRFELASSDLEHALGIGRAAGDPRLVWRTLFELGKLWASRDYRRAYTYLQEALHLARQLNDPVVLARSLNRMGNWHANDENPGKALPYHQEALRIFEGLNDRPNLANTLDLLGIVHLLHGDNSMGAAYYNRAIELFREMGNDPRLVSSLISRALAAMGTPLLALVPASLPRDPFADLDEAMEIARRIGLYPDEAWAAWASTTLYILRGDYGRALQSGQRGLAIATNINHREWQVGNYKALGDVYNELWHPELALPHLEPGLALAKKLRSQYWVNHVTGALAKSYMLLGDLMQAQRCLDNAIPQEMPMDTAGRRFCWARRAELALAMDEPTLALDIADRLVKSAVGLEPGDVLAFLWLVRGEALIAMQLLEEARAFLVAGRDKALQEKERFLLWRFHATLGRLYRTAGSSELADQELSAARALIGEMAATIADDVLQECFRHRAFATLSSS